MWVLASIWLLVPDLLSLKMHFSINANGVDGEYEVKTRKLALDPGQKFECSWSLPY